MSAPDPLPEDDHRKCGSGQKALCCRYLVFLPPGFTCARDHLPGIKLLLDERHDMTAQRLPQEPYPDCQLKPS